MKRIPLHFRRIAVLAVLVLLATPVLAQWGHGPHHGRFHEMERVSDGGNDDFGLVRVVLEDGHRLLHEIHPHMADVIQPAHEGGNVGGTRLGRQEESGKSPADDRSIVCRESRPLRSAGRVWPTVRAV